MEFEYSMSVFIRTAKENVQKNKKKKKTIPG